MPLAYDPEVAAAVQRMAEYLGPLEPLAVHDVAGRRAQVEKVQELLAGPGIEDVEEVEYSATSLDGSRIPILCFRKKSAPRPSQSDPGAVIVHCHGGGLISGSPTTFRRWLAGLVSETGVPAFSVDYRLAPEHPYPTPVEDCYAAVVWLQEHSSELSVEPSRICIMGESAGGGLAAAVALVARDRRLSPKLAKQILLCPMLDDRNLGPIPAIEPFAYWKADDNVTGWTAYLGSKVGTNDVPATAAPARARSVDGLPPVYLDVGTLDIFRDEALQFGARLVEADIDAEVHVFPGVPHAFEHIAPESEIARAANRLRVRACMSF